MQLRHYWAVVWRRRLVVTAVVALALLGGLALLLPQQRQFSATLRVLVNRVPTQAAPATPDFRFDGFYRYQATEYMLDDLVEKVAGNMFAFKVIAQMDRLGFGGWDDARVMRALTSEREHRILIVEATAGSREEALALVQAVEQVLTTEADATAPPDGSRVNVQTIHRDPAAHSNWQRLLLIYILQAMLALLLGLGLAFLLDYLDDRVRDADDARTLGVPLLGQLPAASARSR
jgi:capsular polysaccharide biosynthesis protein